MRNWIDISVTAQKNAHLSANLPYVDLMFAFGLATLGDATTGRINPVDAARNVMAVPIPTGGTSNT